MSVCGRCTTVINRCVGGASGWVWVECSWWWRWNRDWEDRCNVTITWYRLGSFRPFWVEQFPLSHWTVFTRIFYCLDFVFLAGHHGRSRFAHTDNDTYWCLTYPKAVEGTKMEDWVLYFRTKLCLIRQATLQETYRLIIYPYQYTFLLICNYHSNIHRKTENRIQDFIRPKSH